MVDVNFKLFWHQMPKYKMLRSMKDCFYSLRFVLGIVFLENSPHPSLHKKVNGRLCYRYADVFFMALSLHGSKFITLLLIYRRKLRF